MEHEHRDDTEPPAIRARRDTGGAWATAWPLLALALTGLMVVSTCVPAASVSLATPPALTAPSAR